MSQDCKRMLGGRDALFFKRVEENIMEARYIFIIIILVMILVIIGLVFFAVYKITKKIRHIKREVRAFSREFLGTSDIKQGIRQIEQEYAATPKSVSGATDLCLPRISADFPDFHYEEMKRRAENVLLSYLSCVSLRSADELQDANTELKRSLEHRVNYLKANGKQEYFDQPKIHRTEIASYTKNAGRCTITFQSSIQYKHYMMDMHGNRIYGNENTWEQSRYNMELIYIQDREIVEKDMDGVEGRNCPNCGAPLTHIGSKNCRYCGTPIVEYNIKVWTFSSVKEVK